MHYKRYLTFRFISTVLIFLHLCVFSLRDATIVLAEAEDSAPTSDSSASTETTQPQETIDSSSDASEQTQKASSNNAQPEKETDSQQGGDGQGENSGSTNPPPNSAPTSFNLNALNNLSPSLFTGAITYSVPIVVPAGRKGIQPNVALTYSSQSGNGILGMGWDMDLGSIERSTKKGVPNYDSSDTFIFKSGGSTQELVNIGGTEYRAKIEGAFMKFQNNGSLGWVVTDKSGIKYYFGQTSTSQQYDPNNASHIFKWCLDKVQDTLGNYMTLTYIKDINQIYPDTINYTGHQPFSLSPAFQVKFDYLDNRADYFFSYRSNFLIKTTKLLQTITVNQNGLRIRKYALNYQQNPGTKGSLLSSVVQYGLDDSTFLPPITFSYQAPDYSFGNISNWTGVQPTWPAYPTNWNAIMNGDSSKTYINTLDMNGDGLPDRVSFRYLDTPYAPDFWDVQLNNGSGGFGGPQMWQKVQPAVSSDTYNWNAIRHYTGSRIQLDTFDINGDGLPDRVSFNYFNAPSYWDVQLNNGSGFGNPTQWTNVQPTWPADPPQWNAIRNGDSSKTYITTLDMNGDGLPDRVSFRYLDANGAPNYWDVQLNNGSGGFGGPQMWQKVQPAVSSDTYNWNAISHYDSDSTHTDTFDINGDGLPDRVSFNHFNAPNYWEVQFNNGSGFENPIQWPNVQPAWPSDPANWNAIRHYTGNRIQVDTFDINADGLPDRVSFKHPNAPNYWEVQLNNGSGFENPIQWPDVQPTWPPDPSNWNAIRNGDNSGKTYITTLDMNGDGLTDRASFRYFDGPSYWDIQINKNSRTLLSGVSNGIGGTASVTYQSYKGADNTQYPDKSKLPFPVQVVTQISTSDGQGNSYSTSYSYDKGEFNFTEREFRGFGKVKVMDVDGNYSLSYFLQGDYDKGRPYKQESYDAGGNPYTKVDNTWSTQQPYGSYPQIQFVYLSETNAYTFDGDSSARRTKTQYTYGESPQYGNPTQVIEFGEVNASDGSDIGNDMRYTTTTYTYDDVTNWILALPNHSEAFDINNNKVSEKWFYYDNNSSHLSSPTVGLLTKEEVWRYDPITSIQDRVSSIYSYDSYGNLLSASDANNHTTTTLYDTTYYIYPLKVTNAIGHFVETEYYGINGVPLDDGQGYKGLFGQVKSSKDPNGVQSYNTYDDLGRLEKAIGPNDSMSYPGAIYEYDLNVTNPQTDPVKITKKVKTTNSPNSTNYPDYYTSYSFSDGLGRTIESKTDAEPDPTTGGLRQIIAGVTQYNTRGLVDKKYLPYFVDASPNFDLPNYAQPYSSFQYDGMGRVTQSTNPDNTYSTTSYSDWVVNSTDENSHYHTYYYDAYQRLIQVDEHNQGATYTTRYEYDALGNLTKVTDNQGNITQITYDSLGRKVQMSDPDMGVWNYEYDNVGNLTKQIDAAGQELIFTYDDINRLTQKTIQQNQNVVYEYDNLSKPYSKGRLTKVSYTAGSTEFFYDNLGREIQSIKTVNSTLYTVNRTYDPLDRLATLTYPDGEVVTYTYNPQGIETVKSSSATADPYTKLLLHNDGPDGSTNFTDSSSAGHSVFANGNAQIDTAQYKFGGASGLFGGATGDTLTAPDSSDWALGSGDWTVDFWVMFNSFSPSAQYFYFQDTDTVNLTFFRLGWSDSSDKKLLYSVTENGVIKAEYKTGSLPLNPGTWHHIALVRSGTTIYMFLDGESQTVTESVAIGSFSIPDFTGALTIGSLFDGGIDEYRVSKGIARWTSDFTVPQAPYSSDNQPYVTNTDYSPTSQILKIQYGNGTETNYAYDPNTLRLNQLQTTNNQQQTIQNLGYSFDNVGNIFSIVDGANNGRQDFLYDDLNRLTYANGTTYGAINYSYDSIGNLLTKGTMTLQYNNSRPHAVSSYTDSQTAQTINFNYDANGNLRNRTNAQTGAQTNYYYDYESHLSKTEQIYAQGTPMQVSLQLNPGWNFFSLPLIPNDSNIANIFSSLISYPSPDSYTKLLLHNDGPDGSTTFTDSSSSAHTVAANGNAQIDTAQSKFGGASGLFGGATGDTLTAPDSSDWALGSGDWTVDFWVMFKSFSPSAQYFYFQNTDTVNLTFFRLGWSDSSDKKLVYSVTENGVIKAEYKTGSLPLNPGTWHHIALVRSGTTIYMFLDGISQTVTESVAIGSFSIPDFTGALTIGSLFDGGIDEYRFSKGVARWTSNFTPPALSADYDQVSRYEPTSSSFEHFVGDAQFDQFNTLEYGKGYAIYVNNSSGATVTINGTAPAPQGINLTFGSNLIPYPYLSQNAVQQGLGNLQLNVDYDLVSSYNQATGQFDQYPGNLANLDPEKSYYLRCLTSPTWNIQPLSRETDFSYDGDGGRVTRVSQIDKANTTTYIGSLFENTDYADGSPTTRKKHIYAGANRVCVVDNGSPQFYHSDHLGSSNVITDATGQQVSLYEYSPFGEVSYQSGSYTTDIKYTGKIQDDTGLYYYGARYYDPVLGRFISPDTIVQAPYDPQSLNRYSYCRNNPINLIDPTGHSWKKFWNSFAGAFLGAIVTVITGGLGAPFWLAGMAGGFFGGALTGGLEGGWQGALMGGIMGGALGGLGGWGFGIAQAHQMAGQYMAGMIIAGAGVAGATDSWDSFAGGFSGGLAGWAAGSGITSAYKQQFKNFRAGNGFVSDRDAQFNNFAAKMRAGYALNANQRDRTITKIVRPLGGDQGNPGSLTGPRHGAILSDELANGEFQMGPYNKMINTSNTVDDLSGWGTYITTQKSLALGGRYVESFDIQVNMAALKENIALYEQTFAGKFSYDALNHNSNFAVNSVIYGAGGDIPQGGRAPGFPDSP